MMRYNYRTLIILPLLLLISCTVAGKNEGEKKKISGSIENGYRILDVGQGTDPVNFTVYRGDYLKFKQLDDSLVFRVPALDIEQIFNDDDTFIKMKEAGVFTYSFGEKSGTIEVVEYVQSHYREVSSEETADWIKKEAPILLDVRTRQEYSYAHIEDAILIPVQELQSRISEIEKYKNVSVLIYCASGNRSTVASKLLIDAGFNDISNLRYGIRDWIRKSYPVQSER